MLRAVYIQESAGLISENADRDHAKGKHAQARWLSHIQQGSQGFCLRGSLNPHRGDVSSP